MDQYLLAWGIYLIASCALLWIGWSWTRPIPFAWLRNSIRVLGAVILLTPVAHEDAAEILVPAWAVASFGLLAEGMDVAANAAVWLMVTAVAALIFVVLHSIINGLRGRSARSKEVDEGMSPSVNETGRTGD